MGTKSKDYLRGHPMYLKDGEWFYSDNHQPTVNNVRDCGHCKMKNRKDEHDACIANLPGVQNACCGHGIADESYIQFENGMILRGFAIESSQ